jgi:AraC-like DNA-binding protein
MDRFLYKKSSGITALSASITDFRYKKHSHEEYALGVTLRGIQQYNLDGSFQSSYQNGVMLFNPEQSHDGMAHDKTGIDYVMLYIEPTRFSELLEKKDIRFSSPVVYNKTLQQKIINLSYAVLSEKDEALCNELLLSLADDLRPSLFENYRKDNVVTGKAKEMIHSSLNGVLKLDDISRELGVSKYQFIRMFKAGTGISPYQYFLNCKLEYAKRIIEKTQDVYSAVAECGFVDLTHLNKHFKSIYGITAYEYMSYLCN